MTGSGVGVVLVVHRAERLDTLADGLAELLATPLPDVFATEIVAVPARGVERWLTQQLSHRLGRRPGGADGVCAALWFPSPTELVARASGFGPGRRFRDDPWGPGRLVWPLLEVLDDCADQPWAATLSAHLHPVAGAEPVRSRRYAVARRLAGLFAGYAEQRAAMIAGWLAGSDTDGWGHPLPADLAWQPPLWRALRLRVDAPDPVTAQAAALERIRSDRAAVDWPHRISVFGSTRMPPAHLQLLLAAGRHRDVHLWLPHPSPALFDTVARAGLGPGRRADDASLIEARHPLLASLGRDSRELQLTLTGCVAADPGTPVVHEHLAAPSPARPSPEASSSQAPSSKASSSKTASSKTASSRALSSKAALLQRLQAQLRDDRPGPPVQLDPADRSVQVHACHGPARQVEVLREVLLERLAADPTLEPRDVLVMCPDIETFAPLIGANFGLAEVLPGDDAHPAHRLRVRLADRALVQTNPLLATADRLLDLVAGRATASQLLDLAGWAPVRRRFRFDDDEFDQLSRWVAAAGVRWGLDAAHREPFRLHGFRQNTWRAGLDRILLGVSMAEEDGNQLGLALPLDEVDSSDVDLAGRLAEFFDRVVVAVAELTGRHPLRHWTRALVDAVDGLTLVPTDEGWQRVELHRVFTEIEDEAGTAADRVELTLVDVRALLAGRLAGRPTRANFRTGTLTVCTMVPMRSVPHRVVALLGLDDGVFPRNPRPDGDDVLARDPGTGERDARGEDRQLLLDAILAATQTLIVTYSGADERTGAVKPPAVPLGELLDALDAVGVTAGGRSAGHGSVIRHPLQPFDVRCVTPAALGTPGPFSHDPGVLAAAWAAAAPRRDPPSFLPTPLPDRPPADIDLADLVAMLVHPARGFLRQRLDVSLGFESEDPSDSLTVELDALAQWSLGDRLLRDRLGGADEAKTRQAEWLRGVLPPGPLGGRILDTVLDEVAPLLERVSTMRTEPARTVDISVDLGAGRRLRGTVPVVHGSTALSVGYSKLGPKPQLTAWIWLLALTLSGPAGPDLKWRTVAVGRGAPGRPRTATFGPVEPGVAASALAELVTLFDRGLRAPLPLPLKTSAAYASTVREGRGEEDARVQAARSWTSAQFPGEDADPAHRLVLDGTAPFARLLRTPAPSGDPGSVQLSYWERLALRLWNPLLSSVVVESGGA